MTNGDKTEYGEIMEMIEKAGGATFIVKNKEAATKLFKLIHKDPELKTKTDILTSVNKK